VGSPGTASSCSGDILPGLTTSIYILTLCVILAILVVVASLWVLANLHDVRKTQKPITARLTNGVYLLFASGTLVVLVSLAFGVYGAITNTPTTGC
jgi:choline-glycine betaine transporter